MTRLYTTHNIIYLAFYSLQTSTLYFATNFLLNLNHLVLLYFRTSIITIVLTIALYR